MQQWPRLLGVTRNVSIAQAMEQGVVKIYDDMVQN